MTIRILLVEDNADNCEMLTKRLKHKDYEVTVATNGEEAITLAHTLLPPPNIILMDLSLPIIDGWEATRRLKADPKTQPIPIIALTAHAMANDRQKALQAGCNDYDTKPIDFSRLLSKIEALL
jgi:CheY-like chemotaxis protein